MVAIKVLPPEIVNRIAAGEVIERPASLVKELVENAIDAGSRRVFVLLEEGGRKRIRVRDDGCGIAREDLSLAFQSHATSKLSLETPDADSERDWEFNGVDTLGFRGEALASIASVADVEVLSRTSDSECGFRYRPGGGDVEAEDEPEPTAAPEGTTIEVRNLFGRTPARRKFLKTVSTELSHVTEHVLRVALAYPAVAFRVEHGKRVVLDLPAVKDVRDRVGSVIGSEKAEDLLEVEHRMSVDGEGAELRVTGFVGKPRLFRGDHRGQHCFINGRWVRDKVVTHALRDAFQGFQISGRFPLSYLYLELPGDQVDINVHPQKTEVRFVSSQAIHRLICRAVRGTLEKGASEALSVTGPTAPGAGDESSVVPEERRSENSLPGPSRSSASTSPDAQVDRYSALPPRPSSGSGGRLKTGSSTSPVSSSDPVRGEASSSPLPSSESLPFVSPSSAPADAGGAGDLAEAGDLIDSPGAGAAESRRLAFQVLREFIVFERGNELVVMDQHALHEKVLYERVLARLESGRLLAQRLLMPEVVRLEPDEVPLIEELVARLEVFGFEIETFGEQELAIHAVPVLLDRGPASEVVQEVVRWVRDRSDGQEDETREEGSLFDRPVREIAQLMACKQAVKAGMKLESQEIEALLQEVEGARDPRFCPHGRPTSVVLRREEIEKWFDRK